jgi:hypothetical protein
MWEAERTYETSDDNNFTRQYIPEDNSEEKVIIYFNKINEIELAHNTVSFMSYIYYENPDCADYFLKQR